MLTELQFKLLHGIATSDFRDGASDEEMRGGYAVWTDSVLDDISEASRGGVVAKAIEAGLVRVQGTGRDSVIRFTPEGWDAYVAEKAERGVK